MAIAWASGTPQGWVHMHMVQEMTSGQSDLDRVGRGCRARQVLDAGDGVRAGPCGQEVLVDLEVLLAEAPHAPRQQRILPGLPAVLIWHMASLAQ